MAIGSTLRVELHGSLLSCRLSLSEVKSLEWARKEFLSITRERYGRESYPSRFACRMHASFMSRRQLRERSAQLHYRRQRSQRTERRSFIRYSGNGWRRAPCQQSAPSIRLPMTNYCPRVVHRSRRQAPVPAPYPLSSSTQLTPKHFLYKAQSSSVHMLESSRACRVRSSLTTCSHTNVTAHAKRVELSTRVTTHRFNSLRRY